MLQIDLSYKVKGSLAGLGMRWDKGRFGWTSGEGRTEMFCISSIWYVIKVGWSLGCSFELVHLQSLWALLGIEKTSECWIFTSVAHHYILISWHALSLVNNILHFLGPPFLIWFGGEKISHIFWPRMNSGPFLRSSPLLSVYGINNRLCPWLVGLIILETFVIVCLSFSQQLDLSMNDTEVGVQKVFASLKFTWYIWWADNITE